MSGPEEYEIARLAIELKKLAEFSSTPLSHLIGEAIMLLLQCRARRRQYRVMDENSRASEEGRILAGLKNPQRRAAVLSEQRLGNESLHGLVGGCAA